MREADPDSANFGSYVDADALLLAAGSDLPGHEIFYVAAADNAGGHDVAATLRQHHGDRIELRELDRVDASGISTAKAARLLGWRAKRSWRDHLDADGRALPKA